MWQSILNEKLYNLQVTEAWFKPKKTKAEEEERRKKKERKFQHRKFWYELSSRDGRCLPCQTSERKGSILFCCIES